MALRYLYLIMTVAAGGGYFAEFRSVTLTDLVVLIIIVATGYGPTTTLPYAGFSASREWLQRFVYSTMGYVLIGGSTGIVFFQAEHGVTSWSTFLLWIVLASIPLAIWASAAQSTLLRLNTLLQPGVLPADVVRQAVRTATDTANPEAGDGVALLQKALGSRGGKVASGDNAEV